MPTSLSSWPENWRKFLMFMKFLRKIEQKFAWSTKIITFLWKVLVLSNPYIWQVFFDVNEIIFLILKLEVYQIIKKYLK